jgi:DNA-binding NtrC family response regulator
VSPGVESRSPDIGWGISPSQTGLYSAPGPADNSGDARPPGTGGVDSFARGRRPLSLKILIVEEQGTARETWTDTFRQAGHRVFSFASARSALDGLGDAAIDVAFLSFADPETTRRLQDSLKKRNPACQVTLLTDRPSEERDALALEAGAREILLRPLPEGRLESVVERVVGHRRKRQGRTNLGGVETLLGESPGIDRVRRLIRQVAAVPDTSVLITGESGTGKELVARAIHAESLRAPEPFLEINCAAIPENLLESELFGHEQGAFTDATRMKPGLFELADRGTLFLDEVGELGLELQAKLLRVLDTRSIRRVAGRETMQLDVRILTATNRDLTAEVQARRFRQDLFHRLNVVHIELPPLRTRGDDLALLAGHFVALFARKFGRPTPPLDELLLRRLANYSWPGNVRELANSVERAVLLAEGRPLALSDFPFLDEARRPARVIIRQPAIEIDFSGGPIPLEDIEREVLRQGLLAADGNVSEAARLLGLGRGALRYKLARFGLDRQRRAG